MKTIKDTSLLTIRIGDKIQFEDKRIGQLIAMELCPNGFHDPKIVVLLTMKTDTGKVQATSDRFNLIENELYLERIY